MATPALRTRAIIAALLTLSTLAVAPAEARRGGSFGSRGSRTYGSASYGSAGYGARRTVPPVERSMTPRPAPGTSGYGNEARAPGYAGQTNYRPAGSRFGGFGGGLIGGLIAGGLIGHFLGNGMGGGWGAGGGGGGGGLLLALLQIAIIGGLIWLVIGFFRRRQTGGAAPGFARDAGYAAPPPAQTGWGAPAPATVDAGEDIAISPADQQAFERLLVDVQDAFGREDYGRLRQLTTPEIMSYLSEELSQNATRGVRNEVSGTRLIDAEIVEAWREASGDYATAALRYESIDVMRDRATGALAAGSVQTPTETTELWTFVRRAGDVWKLSAIQDG